MSLLRFWKIHAQNSEVRTTEFAASNLKVSPELGGVNLTRESPLTKDIRLKIIAGRRWRR